MKVRSLSGALIVALALALTWLVTHGTRNPTASPSPSSAQPEYVSQAAVEHSPEDSVPAFQQPKENSTPDPGVIRDPLNDVLAKSQRIASREEPFAKPNERKNVALYRNDTARYSLIRVEETLRLIPGRAEPVLSRVAMVGDQVLVKVKGPDFEKNFTKLVQRLNVEGRRALRTPGAYLVRTKEIDLNAVPDLTARLASQRDLVAIAEPDYLFVKTAAPEDPDLPRQWGLNNVGQAGGVLGADIRALEAWELKTSATGVVVAIIDTGIDYTHPDLANNIWTNAGEIPGNAIDDDHNGFVDDVRGWDFTKDANDPYDENNHGTHVAGVIGARGNNGIGIAGVTWDVSLMPIKFLDKDGLGLTSDAVDAVNYAISNGADIACAAWSGRGLSIALQNAFGSAATAGIVTIASAGNEGADTDADPSYPAAFDLAGLVSVGASDGADKLAGFSNYGVTSVDLVAPGVGIYSTIPNGEFGTFSGTSTAAPLAAGAVALLKASEPELTAGEIKTRLLTTSHAIAELQGKTSSGGRLDVAALLSAAPIRVPVIAGPFKRAGMVGRPFQYSIHAVHDPTSYGATPLPAGLSIDPNTGVISGTPQTEGLFYVTLSAGNTAGTTSATLELEISGSGAPEILSASNATAIVGLPFSYQILASNNPGSYAASDLPAGLSINSSTGLISGTPTEAGSYRVRISATNGAGTGDLVLLVSVNYPAPVITSSLTATAVLGRPFYYAITTSSEPDSFDAVGLPDGLHLNKNAGIVFGVPKVIGTYSVGLSASNASGTGNVVLTLNVVDPNPATRIFSFSPASAAAGETLTLTGQGFTNASDVYFADWRDQLHAATFTVVSDSELRVVVPDFLASWSRNYASRITVVSPAGATVTLPGDIRVVHSGESILAQGGGSSYLIENGGAVAGGGSGSLLMYLHEGAAADAGLGGGHTFYVESGAFAKLSGSGGCTIFQEPGGVILFGTGTNDPSSRFQRVVEVPALNPSVLNALPRILPVPKITSSPTATAVIGQLFSYTISTGPSTDFLGMTFGATGLPAGLSVDAASGLISGIPTQSGVFPVTLSASNSNGTGTLILTLTVNGSTAPIITNARPVEAQRGQSFSFAIQATNSPTNYAATGLPTGLSIDPMTGIISGAATVSGVFRADISASNAEGTGSARLLILVDRTQPKILSFSQPTAVRGEMIRIQGEGFTDATRVLFSDRLSSFIAANFTVLSDTEVLVEIPDMMADWSKDYRSLIVLDTPAGATVTVPPDFQSVTTTITPSSVSFYIVRSGGALSGLGSGGVSAYLEKGSLATTGGGGGHLYFLEAGASINVNSTSGGHHVFHEPGALITGTPQFLSEVASLNASTPAALLRVYPLPKITSSTFQTGTVGHQFSYQIQTEAIIAPAASYSASGLPAGLSINSSTGVISGIPQVEGTFNIILGATNQYGTGTALLKLVVDDPKIPIISANGSYTMDLGYPFSLSIVASYNPTSYSASGLPPGLSINPLTGVISGTPSVGGSYDVTVTATNGNGSGSKSLSFLVGLKPTLITSLPSVASVGSVLDIGGQGFANTSAVYLSDWRDELISATFTVASDSLLRVTVPDTAYSFQDSTTRILIVTPAGATVTVPPNYVAVTGSVAGSSVSFYVVENGGTLDAASGGVKAYLRTGASVSTGGGGGHTYFVESGATVTLGGGGGSHRVIRATGATVIGTPAVSIPVVSLRPSVISLLRVVPAPGITSSRVAQASIGLPFIHTVTATNSPTSFGAQGLPPGLTINPNNGIISGRPVGNDRIYEVTLTATNAWGSGSATLLLTVRDDYKHWKIASFAPLLGGAENPLAHDLADADGDGMSNLLEFSGGLDPLDPRSQSMPLIPVKGGTGCQFQYRRLKGNGSGTTEAGYTLGTITYTVYVSTDLSDWKTGPSYLTQVGTPIDNGDGTETVTVQPNSSAANQFGKLVIKREEL